MGSNSSATKLARKEQARRGYRRRKYGWVPIGEGEHMVYDPLTQAIYIKVGWMKDHVIEEKWILLPDQQIGKSVK